MSDSSYIPGQRWLSEAEADLGLGTVLRVDDRCVHMVFPASGERRTYALHGAPLSRVRFSIGDEIEDHQGALYTISEVHEEEGLLVYLAKDEQGVLQTLGESLLSDELRLNRPQDKLLTSRIDPDLWFSLRYRAWQRLAEMARSPLRGLVGARIGLVPHQLYIAAEVGGRFNPRVLLADEVGLGKTIEAGLVLHRLLLTGRVRRALLVVPEALLHQWLVEMLRRFNLRFTLFDDGRFAAGSEGENPFLGEQRVLCSLEFLASRPTVARAALAGEWDFLVVDEAHHLAWSEEEASLEYELVSALAERAKGVLLLTATPEQLGRAGHFGRLRLLDPHRFHDYRAFLAEEQAYEPVADIAARLLDGAPLDEAQQQLLAGLMGDQALADPAQLVDRLVDRHGTGRVLFRNTRAAIKGFPGRRLHATPLPYPERYRAHEVEVHEGITPEVLDPEWVSFDPRVEWLTDTLRRLAPEKVLVICAHASTVLQLREYLHGRKGIHAAVFHEEMEIVERDRAAAYFADMERGAQVLICSEIGSEGRNFQFAHHLVLFDLPFEPELLEQRIGRLDRIGQRETIQIHVPYFQQAAGEVLYRWYHEALNAFEAICPAAAAVFEQLDGELLAALLDPEQLDELIRDASRLTAELNAAMEAGRDRLLELHSHNSEVSAGIATGIAAQDADPALQRYLEDFWDAYGTEHEPGPGHSMVLHPGEQLIHEHLFELDEEGLTVTFDRADAQVHEDREFLTWEHPLVQGAMEGLASADIGSSALTLMRRPGTRGGTLMFELIYVAECLAPAELEVKRFLPPTPIRLLLDAQGQDLAASLPHEELNGQCLTRNRPLAAQVIKSQLKLLRALYAAGEKLAQRQADGLVDEALGVMTRQLNGELERLADLARVNPNVRQDELEQLAAVRDALAGYMRKTRIRLDASRLIVFG